jgi:glutamine synthetase
MPAHSIDSAKEWLVRHEIAWVRVEWPDLNGLARGRVLPVAALLDASRVFFCDACLSFDLNSVPVAAAGASAQREFGNVQAIPDLNTLRLWPVQPRTAWCLCDVHLASNEPAPTASRNFARRIDAELTRLGLTCRVAPELEFYLMSPDGQALERGSPCYGLEASSSYEEALEKILAVVGTFWTVEGWHHEHGPGQFEINVGHVPLLEAADALYATRVAVRTAAAQAGLRATFLAKPYSDLNGSSCQLNFSLQDQHGTALFSDPHAPQALSDTCRYFVGGILEQLDVLAAILLPNGNSFRRIVPGHFAPVARAWGLDNRSAAVRVVSATPTSTRVEVRVPGADIAAHLAIPALVAAGLRGISTRRSPGPPARGNLDDSTTRITDDWGRALDAFAGSSWIAETLGPELAAQFLQVKLHEYARFRGCVSDFDRREYGSQF